MQEQRLYLLPLREAKSDLIMQYFRVFRPGLDCKMYLLLTWCGDWLV